MAYLTAAEARKLACPRSLWTSEVSGLSSPALDFLTLRQAVDVGVLPWSYEVAKKRLQRRGGEVPKARGKEGNADLFARQDLNGWTNIAARERP